MKALGIIRKLDDLGRLVIPKEVRDSQGWDSGQPMEMFMSNEGLVVRKYGVDHEKNEVLTSLYAALNHIENEEAKNIMWNAIKFIKKQ